MYAPPPFFDRHTAAADSFVMPSQILHHVIPDSFLILVEDVARFLTPKALKMASYVQDKACAVEDTPYYAEKLRCYAKSVDEACAMRQPMARQMRQCVDACAEVRFEPIKEQLRTAKSAMKLAPVRPPESGENIIEVPHFPPSSPNGFRPQNSLKIRSNLKT